ncbi:DUF2029 domain-containing protein [Sphingomonas sinipercae]|uniref:DUF2029 domain-containing protein n=1 Tax=Sphingomonas sinipercae TaxID=2714944 RepID=A0A6G7ZPJ8_9SPHN|nr:glycosyltransferase family 87 protein [Sphingomonas sinipercae]QIL02858.1 DUF2029 domain-containing protein [Sphingomonas sinipercae]
MEALATGSWLTAARVRRVALVAGIASIVSLLWLFAFAHGTLDAMGRPLGTDFSQVWTAGTMVLDGRAADVWSWPKHFAVQQQFHHSRDVPLYGWHYPPPFLLIAAALANLPYIPALFVWQAATLVPLALLLKRMVPRRETLLLSLAAPVTLICVTHGHNGFLTGLLLGGGLLLLERKPFVAGLLLGCLIYKPQLALIIPPLLIVTRNWRATGGAVTSASLLVVLTLALWGWPVWQAFLDSLPLTRTVVIEQGSTGWEKIMSPFAAIKAWGGTTAAAYGVQAILTAAALAAVVILAVRDNRDLRNAAVTAAALVATPYVLDYDFVVLGVGLAFLWRDGEKHGFLRWDRTLMALIWIAPLAARGIAAATTVPLGLITALLVLGISLRRSLLRASPSRHSRAAFAQ